MSTLSVLMSVYKNDNPFFLNQALTSIWDDQILKPNQLVLVLDGKLPNRLNEVIDNWILKLENNLLIVKNLDNIGLTKSLNKGIPHCNSEYIARMDADDISVSKRFMLQVEFLNKNKNIDVVGGSILEFNHNNKRFKRIFPRNQKEILKKIAIASPFSHPTVMFRRKVFLDGNKKPLNFNKKAKTINTKKTKALYEFAHSLYYFDKKFFFKNGKYWNYDNLRYFEINNKYEQIDIDTLEDFKFAEKIWTKNDKNFS